MVGALDGITGFDLNLLAFDTSVGLDCADIDDDDTTPDGAVCYNTVSCCENNVIVSFSPQFIDRIMLILDQQSSLGSVFVGCVPIV